MKRLILAGFTVLILFPCPSFADSRSRSVRDEVSLPTCDPTTMDADTYQVCQQQRQNIIDSQSVSRGRGAIAHHDGQVKSVLGTAGSNHGKHRSGTHQSSIHHSHHHRG